MENKQNKTKTNRQTKTKQTKRKTQNKNEPSVLLLIVGVVVCNQSRGTLNDIHILTKWHGVYLVLEICFVLFNRLSVKGSSV